MGSAASRCPSRRCFTAGGSAATSHITTDVSLDADARRVPSWENCARGGAAARLSARAHPAGRLRSSWHVGSAKSYVCSAEPYVCSAKSYDLAEQTCEMLLRGLRVRKERCSPGCPSPTRVGTARECVGAREGGLGAGREEREIRVQHVHRWEGEHLHVPDLVLVVLKHVFCLRENVLFLPSLAVLPPQPPSVSLRAATPLPPWTGRACPVDAV